MQKNGNSEHDDGTLLTDAWWAALVANLLHPVQVQIIEAVRCVGQPLSLRDLSEIVNDVEWVHLDYHIGRLRKLGALDFAGLRQGASTMDLRYQLVPEAKRLKPWPPILQSRPNAIPNWSNTPF